MDNRIEKSVELAAPVTRVWRALTDSREFGAWFGIAFDGPFVAGQVASGRITFPSMEHLKCDIDVQKIEPERYFSYTWHPYAIDPSVDYSGETPTLVEFTLQPTDAGTRLVVTESGFDKIPAHRFAEAFRMNDRGWSIQMESIEQYVAEHP